MKRILTDLYFEGVAKIRRALLGTETPLVNSEIGYDNTEKRVRVHDGTSAKKLLQENDIDTNTDLGTSDSVVPSQNAVKMYVDSQSPQDGQDGKSAYEIWLDNGNVGTEQDFLNSLIGQNGVDGQDGIDGTNGTNGIDGKSAYQVWLDNGNIGTEQDFLDSLVGQDGINGQDGQNGVGIPIGGTAGQILSKIDGTDYNTQWKNEFFISETTEVAIQNEATTESTSYVSVRRFWNGITRLRAIQNIWIALQTFNSINTKQIYTTKQTFAITGTNPVQAINLDNGSYILLNLTSASGTLILSLSNGRIGGSYWIQVLQAATKVDVSLANEGRFDGDSGDLIVGVNNINYSIFPLFTGTGYLLNIAKQS